MKMAGNENGNENGYDGKTDHEVIVDLEKETAQQATQIAELMSRFQNSEFERLELVKQQNQSAIVRLIFAGIVGLLACILAVSVASWFTDSKNVTEKALADLYALAERILLVLTGILSSVTAAAFESRKSNGG
jgi:cellobiose-specific phosphotransferase system component IIC